MTIIVTFIARLVAILIICFIQVLAAHGASDQFILLSSTKARPLAMGGAFTAVVDDISAIDFNPASFSLYKRTDRRRLTFFINPVSPVFALKKNRALFTGKGSKVDDALLAAGLFLKSVSVSFNTLELGLLFGEERIGLPAGFGEREKFDVSGFRQNHSHSFVGRLRLAEQVSIGAVVSYLAESTREDLLASRTGIGLGYGILLQPEKGLRIGVSFVNLPDSLASNRFFLERIVDESVNVGISYEIAGTKLSLDVRNLGEEQQRAVREFHLGFEQILFTHFALRAGWFKRKEGNHVYSCGIGIFDGNQMYHADKKFAHRNFFVNYALVYDKEEIVTDRLHLLSLFLRL